MNCGLLGRKLGHSYSPQIHSHLGDYTYCLFEKEPSELTDFLKNGDFAGLNVTVPYKKDVIPYLDELTPLAQKLGAVNTIIRKNGKLIGHNTDYFGFETMLKESGVAVKNKKALVLGSGGASNTAVAVLQHWGANVVVISRSGENNYENLHLHTDASLIVNTTPVGMYPHVVVSPIDLSRFPQLEGVLDVIYNPARTQLLLDAKSRGIVAMNGLLMLVAQAKEAAQWFTGSEIANDKVTQIHQILKNQMENIVLIGMPGSGKSTVGAILAEKTGKRLIDADAEIVKLAGKTIPEIFAESGEAGFRALETQVLAELGKQSGLIIATGGGCVTREENYPHLHQNGTLFCLERALEALPTDGRPLSQGCGVAQLYERRAPLYEAFADVEIDVSTSVEEAAEAIMEAIK